MNILETKGLFHDYSGLEVLFDVNLQVKEGERHAIIGPNGAGKTTLFNTITGTCCPSRGKVFFKGKDVTGAKPYQLTRLGLGRSFQITSTFNRLVTFQNVRLAILSKKGIRFNLFRKVDKMDGCQPGDYGDLKTDQSGSGSPCSRQPCCPMGSIVPWRSVWPWRPIRT